MLLKLPWYLIYTRIFLTLFAIVFGYWGILGLPYLLLMVIAALTDVYDGVLARRYNVETAKLRQWDSIADTIFFIGVGIGMFFAYPNIVEHYLWGIGGIVGLEIIRYGYDYTKFRRGASYHAISAKIFGVALLVATIAIMGFGVAYPFMPIALALGIVSEIEGLVISIILKEWKHNVKHLGKALGIRKGSK